MLGAQVHQSSLHCELHLYLDRVEPFLPGSEYFLQLRDVLSYMLQAPLFVTLVLHAAWVSLPILSSSSTLQLGYTSVLARGAQHSYGLNLVFL